MIRASDKILAEGLVKRGLLSQKEVDGCLAEIRASDETLKSYIITRHLVPEAKILEVLSEGFGLQTINLKAITIDKAVIDKVPVKFAWYYKFMPIKIENKYLTLASATPLDVKVQDDIRVHLGLEPLIVLAKETDVLEALNKHYGFAADTIDRIMTKETTKKTLPEKADSGVEDLEKQTEDASVIRLVNQILLDAYQKRATDIHIEPYRHKVRLRYRIDGVLVDANLPTEVKHFLLPILSRLKIMANLSIVEKRLPQDGSTVVKTKDQDLDLRISTIPTPRGESMVIRILPTKVMLFSLERLGLSQGNLKVFRELVKKPHGIILVTGPTGSGKTTTLYACLNEINTPGRKIITIEDPIEYEMEGLTQIQVAPKVNLNFAAGLRSVLRHDPDIIMVGEIRDSETAEIAIRTALTGHLVFSTLHTNDAASGITRLIDMGVEPYLVSSSIEAFVAQRLVRMICPHCKEEVKTPQFELREEIAQSLQIKNLDEIKLYTGRGCENCHQTGYYGRTAIYEVLTLSDEIRAAILEKPRSDYIKRIAVENGMLTLRQDGWKKALQGQTTAIEVMNVTEKEDFLNAPAAGPSPKKELSKSRYRVITKEVLAAKNEYDSRTYARLNERVDITYHIIEQQLTEPDILTTDGIEHSSITKDISAGGLRFVSGYPWPIGTIVDLKIHLSKDERSIETLAKICRIEENKPSAVYSIAAYFLSLPSADRSKIENFVKEKSAGKPQEKT